MLLLNYVLGGLKINDNSYKNWIASNYRNLQSQKATFYPILPA